mgnify:CR=1 FL=1
MGKHTLYELATDFELFQEFADPNNTWAEELFDSTPVSEKLRHLIFTFGVDEEGRNELAANVRDGTYVCENPTLQECRQDGIEVLTDMAFYDALATATETIYGNVSDSVAALIREDYGIY